MKNRTENISVRYRPQHLTKSQKTLSFKPNYWKFKKRKPPQILSLQGF